MDVRRMEDFQTNGIFVLNARKILTRMICVIILVEECQRCHRVFFGENCYQDDKKPSNPKGNSIYQILNNVPSAEYHKKKTERRGNWRSKRFKDVCGSLSVRYVCKMWIMGRVNVLCNQQRKKYVLREQKKKRKTWSDRLGSEGMAARDLNLDNLTFKYYPLFIYADYETTQESDGEHRPLTMLRNGWKVFGRVFWTNWPSTKTDSNKEWLCYFTT